MGVSCYFFVIGVKRQDKKMKFRRKSLLLLTAFAALSLMAEAQGRTVKDEMLHMQQTRKVSFVYDASLKTNIPYKGINLDKLSLKKALNKLFQGTGISYQLKGSYVLLKAAKAKATKPQESRPTPKPIAPSTKAQRHTLSGYVKDENGETLINATVYDLTTHQGAMTNAYGFFSLTLPEGRHELRISYIGFNDKHETISLNADEHKDIMLSEDKSHNLNEVVVTADLNSPLINTQTGKRSLSRDDIKTEFSLFSSPDVVKTLQRMSGVEEGMELASGLYVHGGNNDENLYLIDGTPLYSVNHTLGLFSSFNADVVKNVDFYKSGFPARYGGRLSSIVDVRTADGDFHHFHGSYRIGLLDGGVQLEGPIRKGKTSFNFGLRRSWLDIITRPAFAIYNKTKSAEDDELTLNYFFHDLNAKVTNIFSDRSRMSLSMYSGQDGLTTDSKSDYSDDSYYGTTIYKDDEKNKYTWGNINVALDWQYQFSPKLFANFTAVYTHNRDKLETTEDEGTMLNGKTDVVDWTRHFYHSTINDLGYRMAFDYRPNPHHHIRFGTDYTWHAFHPQTKDDMTRYGDSNSIDTTSVVSRNNVKAHEWNLYGEDEITINSHWSLNAGVNASLFHIQDKNFTSVDPRFAMKYQARPWLSFKASWTTMTQYVHKISNSVLELPTDYWVPTTRKLNPMKSWQTAAGIYMQPDKHWLVSLEGYYKVSHHLLQYNSWSGLEPPAASWETVVMDGRGRYYGMEVDATYKTHALMLQGSYTLSWNKRKYPDFYPDWYYDKFDNRHKINLSARWNISKKVSMYAVWNYHTGNHITIPTQYVHRPETLPDGVPTYDNDQGNSDDFIFERPNNFKLPAYHRLDLGFDFHHTTKHGHERIWNLSLYNVYCHLNSLWVDLDFNHEGKFVIKNRAYIPIIPSFSYTIKF